MPNSTWPLPFLRRMHGQLGEQYGTFLTALDQPSPVSIRFNPAKRAHHNLPLGAPISWCNEGFYLTQRPLFSTDPLWHAGAYYVQEPSSMVLARVVADFFQGPPKMVLDVAAAPGGKSTLIAAMLRPQDILICNEIHAGRFQILKQNMIRWGAPNVWLCREDPKNFYAIRNLFDLILLDAPCSGEGMFRKESEAVNQWSEGLIQQCAGRQQKIIDQIWPALQPEGLLLYSTCTYAPYENEENMHWLINSKPAEEKTWIFPAEWSIAKLHPGYQLWPHMVQGEGFYFCGIIKSSDRVGDQNRGVNTERGFNNWSDPIREFFPERDDYLLLRNNQDVIYAIGREYKSWWQHLQKSITSLTPVLELGQLKGSDFIPAPSLALSTVLPLAVASVEVDLLQAQKFLARQEIRLQGSPGWKVLKHGGLSLGWVKLLSNRVNNYYPKEWRIFNTRLLES